MKSPHAPAHGHHRPRPDRKKRSWVLRITAPTLLLTALAAAAAALLYSSSALTLRQPIAVEPGIADASFRDFSGPLLGADYLEGNTVEPLLNGNDIFPAMIAAIQDAKQTITLESYIWSSGAVSDRFIAALVTRAQAGVKVHCLVDGAGDRKLESSDVARLKAAGVEFAVYARERWYDVKLNLNHRSHRKVLVIDGAVGFIGGVCIDDTWDGNGETTDLWRDTHARVTGPVVRQLQAVFAANWLQTTSRLLTGSGYYPVLNQRGEAIANCFLSGPGERPENARLAYFLAIAAARKSIQLSQGYFVPDDAGIAMLLAARRRGVKVQVVVASKTDSSFGRAASRSRWERLLAAGVEFHAYEPSLYHCKLMIVDDVFVSMGSVNFDNRSFVINDEANINVVDPLTARRFQQSFENDLAHSSVVTLQDFKGRPLYLKAAEYACGLLRPLF